LQFPSERVRTEPSVGSIVDIFIRIGRAILGAVGAFFWGLSELVALLFGCFGEAAMCAYEATRRMGLPPLGGGAPYEPGTVLKAIWDGFKEGWDGLYGFVFGKD
jgi:hypothetical protein